MDFYYIQTFPKNKNKEKEHPKSSSVIRSFSSKHEINEENEKFQFFWSPAEKKEEILTIILEIPANFTVAQAMKLVIESFNRTIDSGKKPVKKINMNEFSRLALAVAKKSGDKKPDLPQLDNEINLMKTGFKNFLLCKKEEKNEQIVNSSSSSSLCAGKRTSSFDIAFKNYSNSLLLKKQKNNDTTMIEEEKCLKAGSHMCHEMKKKNINYVHYFCEKNCFC